MLRRSAAKVARWCWSYGIPRRLVAERELRRGVAGITTHAIASAAFPPNAGHHDPGRGFPLGEYLELVRRFHRELAATRAEP